MADTLLATHRLAKTFGRVQAVRELDLRVDSGDIYGFLGLNGAGKTTTLRMVLGLLHPTAGDVELFGRRVTPGDVEARRDLGALVEGPAFYGHLTGLQNLLHLARLSGPFAPNDAWDLLSTVGLEESARRRASTYSLGMKQRLGIALALAPKPRLVILDEPTNGLDPQGIRDMRELIRALNRDRGITFIVSSHLLHEVENLCTRIAIIRRGRLVIECSTADLLHQGAEALDVLATPAERASEVLVGHLGRERVTQKPGGGFRVAAAPSEAPPLVRALVQGGADVLSIVPFRPTLEQLFLDRAQGTEDAA